jgi:hypothetical protein
MSFSDISEIDAFSLSAGARENRRAPRRKTQRSYESNGRDSATEMQTYGCGK